MTETQFGMVSKWMANGNINQFVTAHKEVNRFELVSPHSGIYSPRLPLTSSTCAVGRRYSGLDLFTRSGDGARGSERSKSSGFSVAPHL